MKKQSNNVIHHHYEKWEDYKNGMYRDIEIREDYIHRAELLFRHPYNFYLTMKYVVEKWKYSTEVNLSNKQKNHRSWLGAAACSYNHWATEKETREKGFIQILVLLAKKQMKWLIKYI